VTDSTASPTRFDRVALTGALVTLVGAAVLPFVELRANRLVPGSGHSLAAAGPWAFVVWGVIALAFVSAVGPSAKARSAASTAGAYGLVAAIAWALGAAAEGLLADMSPVARVSVGGGAWVMLVGAAILGFAGAEERSRFVVRRAGPVVLLVVAVAGALVSGGLDRISLAREFAVRQEQFVSLILGHLAITGASLAAGAAIGVPLGLLAARNRRVRGVALAVTGVIETIPSLALLGLLVVPLAALGAAVPWLRDLGVRGIGPAPGFIALALYSLLPVVRNTYVGLTSVDAAAIDAGRGMGMSRRQLLFRVELPLAAPLVMEGLRVAAVLLTGIATLTVFAGARTLGILIFEGLGQFAPDLILLGALPTIVLAVIADVGMSALARAVTPRGVRVAVQEPAPTFAEEAAA